MSKLYEIDKNIALTVDTTNMQDGEKIAVKIVLVGKNKKELDIKPDTTEVENNKASYKFKIQDIANDLNIDIKTVYSAKLWMDNDGDGIVDYNEEIKIDILRNILQSEIFKNNKILNNISSKQVNKTYSKAKPGTAVKDNEILLIQKAFQKFKINIGNDGLDGKFGNDMKKAIETFQTNYKPTHKIHDDYSLSQTGDISKDDILAIDEALVEEWEFKDGRKLSPWKLSQKGIDFLKGYESEVKIHGKHVLYNDDLGFCTIGYGHLVSGKHSCDSISNISDDFKNGLTDSEAEKLLKKDIEKRENDMNKIIKVPLLQQEFDALFCLYYNIPRSLLSKNTIMKKLNLLDYKGAKEGILLWNKGTYKGIFQTLNGLKKRREAEAKIFEKGIYDSTH